MESFKQILDYIKKDFEIEDTTEITMDFIKLFHKEFNKDQENIKDNLEFLDKEDFESKTMISKWFKENREHDKFIICRNNLYTLLCIAQDIMGAEMLKGIKDMNPENMQEYIEGLLGDNSNSPLAELLQNSPFGEFLNNPELKQNIKNMMEKLKKIDINGLMQQIQSGNFDIGQITNIMNELGLAQPGDASNPLGSAMSLLGGLMGGDADPMANLTPAERARVRREKAKQDYRRKIRAAEKAKKAKRRAQGNRKNRNNKKRRNGGSV